MTRIIAGAAGGRRLATTAGRTTRPTSDRAREGLFSTVEAIRGGLSGAAVLDLFAGSGAVGLEALSRGAADVLLVEADARAARVIKANIAAVGLPGARLVADRVERVLVRGRAGAMQSERAGSPEGPRPLPRDFIFADPPYAVSDDELSRVLTLLASRDWLAPGALVAVERASRSGPVAWPEGFQTDRSRRYGEATLWYGLAAGA
jgi:16S rRNA (guanine966-N2)-methyltransferase